MSYTIQEIKMAAYNKKEPPDMSIRERCLWQCVGQLYEDYRADPSRAAECKENMDGAVELFLNLESKEYV